MSGHRWRLVGIVVVGVIAIAAILSAFLPGIVTPFDKRPLPGPEVTPLPVPALAPLPSDDVRVLTAGDIGLCDSPGVAATGSLLAADPAATVIVLGDNAYDKGSAEDYATCYDPYWGHARDRTLPVAGNHEYRTTDAAGYFGYFGDRAGTQEQPWQATDLGAWRVYLLDSECGRDAPCSASDQLAWLRADLAENPAACTLAAWHRPRFSSGPHGSNPSVDDLWRTFVEAGGDVVLAGHDHLYERFARLDAEGRTVAEGEPGARSFVVGTGGGQLYGVRTPLTNSEARGDASFGVLELVLRPGGYDWAFRAVLGEPYQDTGSGPC